MTETTGRRDPSSVRAKDADQETTRVLLEHAFAEGQLDPDTQAERRERAQQAVTLADLDALVDDLQDPLPVSPHPRRRWRRWIAGAAAFVVLSGGGIAVATTRDDPPPADPPTAQEPVRPDGADEADDPAPKPEPKPKKKPAEETQQGYTFTADGLTWFITEYRDQFGTTEFLRAGVTTGRIVLDLPAEKGGLRDRWYYQNDRFTITSTGIERLPFETAVLDWRDLDVAKLFANLRDARRTLPVKNQSVVGIDLRRDDGDARAWLVVKNAAGACRYNVATFDGHVTERNNDCSS